MGFSGAAFALLFVTAGLSGFNMSRHARFVNGTAWSDTVILWEVALGVAALALATFYLRRAYRGDTSQSWWWVRQGHVSVALVTAIMPVML